MRDEHFPQIVCKIEDRKWDLKGFLVIDTLLSGHCAGGVRVTPTVTEEEVSQLARSMSKKFAFLNMCMGGAKAGILISENRSLEERNAILRMFGERIGFLLRRWIYFPGTDMGTDIHDIDAIYKGANVNFSSKDNNIDSGYFTAIASVMAAREIAKHEGIDFKKAKVCIEGFGKVGSAIAADIFNEAKIIGVSTIRGAIYNNRGIDINRLIQIKKDNYDLNLVYKDADNIGLEELLESDTDLLFLCGKPHAITRKNVNKIKARIIIGGGNLCFDDGVEEILYERGIYALPDFITSCGGVLGLKLYGEGLSNYYIIKLIREEFAAKISKLIELSWERGKYPIEVANNIVNENIYRMKTEKYRGKLNGLLKLLRDGKWCSTASKIAINILPNKYYRSPKIQDILYFYQKEQFWRDRYLYN